MYNLSVSHFFVFSFILLVKCLWFPRTLSILPELFLTRLYTVVVSV